MSQRPLIIFALAAVLVAGAVYFFLQSEPKPEAPPSSLTSVATPPPMETPPPTPATPPPVAVATPPVAPILPAPRTPPPVPEWDAKIDQILTSNAGETETAQMLINLMPTLPPDGQAEAAQHISNLITDKDYNRVLPLLRNPNLPEEVQDVLVTDLMNRDNTVKLPALLDVAKIPNHPYHEEALTDLQIFLETDNGTDWGKWNASVQEFLKKEAAENAETK